MTDHTSNLLLELHKLKRKKYDPSTYFAITLEMEKYSLLNLPKNEVKKVHRGLMKLSDQEFAWLYMTIMDTVLGEYHPPCRNALHLFNEVDYALERYLNIYTEEKNETWYKDAYFLLGELNSCPSESLQVV